MKDSPNHLILDAEGTDVAGQQWIMPNLFPGQSAKRGKTPLSH
jgi:hypothetical protein